MQRQRGFTLVELMVVMALIAIISGVSSAFFTHFDRRFVLERSAAEISSALKIARNFSLREKNSTEVEIDAAGGWIECRTIRTVGCWHLEDSHLSGAFGRDAEGTGVGSTPGKTGKAALFAGKGTIDAGALKRFDISEGFSLRFWIHPQPTPEFTLPDSQILWSLGGMYRLEMQGVVLVLAAGNQNFPIDSIPLCRWTCLEIEDDFRTVRCRIDGLLKAEIPWEREARTVVENHLIWGGFFYGGIDEIQLFAPTVSETLILPREVRIAASPKKIFFDRYGRLEPLIHLGPERIVLESEGAEGIRTVRIDVSPAGDVETDSR